METRLNGSRTAKEVLTASSATLENVQVITLQQLLPMLGLLVETSDSDSLDDFGETSSDSFDSDDSQTLTSFKV